MKFVLITGGIHDTTDITALLLEPDDNPPPLQLRAQAFLSLYPDGEADEFADWLVNEHGYQRLTFDEAWLPPARNRPEYAFSVEEKS